MSTHQRLGRLDSCSDRQSLKLKFKVEVVCKQDFYTPTEYFREWYRKFIRVFDDTTTRLCFFRKNVDTNTVKSYQKITSKPDGVFHIIFRFSFAGSNGKSVLLKLTSLRSSTVSLLKFQLKEWKVWTLKYNLLVRQSKGHSC